MPQMSKIRDAVKEASLQPPGLAKPPVMTLVEYMIAYEELKVEYGGVSLLLQAAMKKIGELESQIQ